MIMTTFEFSTHKPVHFGSDVVILTTASLFGEHGTGANTTVTHTYCIGHLETWGVAIPPIYRFSNNLLSYLRRWLFCLWMIKMIWTCRKNEGGGGSNWWGEVPGVLIRAGHYDDSHCIFWQIQWSYPIRQSIDNVGVEKTSPRLPPRPMKGPPCAALASTTGIRIWIPIPTYITVVDDDDDYVDGRLIQI